MVSLFVTSGSAIASTADLSASVRTMDDSNTPFERVMAHQTSAFGAIFTMFTELKEANKVLEERVQDLAMGRAKDQLKIKELDEEIKVSKV